MPGGKVSVADLSSGLVPSKTNGEEVYVKAIPYDTEDSVSVKPTGETVPVDLANLFNTGYQRFSTLITNNSGVARSIIFGGAKAGQYGSIPLQLPAGAQLGNGLATVLDKLGASTPAIEWLNEWLWSNPVIVKKIIINTDNTAAGLTQRSNRITPFQVSTNLDGCNITGPLPFFDSEFSGVMTKQAIPLDSRRGIQYIVNNGQTVTLEIQYLAISVPSFEATR